MSLELIKAFNEVMQNKNKYEVNKILGHQGIPETENEGYQDEYNEYFLLYKHPNFPENIYLRETYCTDSYGDNDSITDICFVQGKEKSVLVYEKIKF